MKKRKEHAQPVVGRLKSNVDRAGEASRVGNQIRPLSIIE